MDNNLNDGIHIFFISMIFRFLDVPNAMVGRVADESGVRR
jgi:hypothetical protein